MRTFQSRRSYGKSSRHRTIRSRRFEYILANFCNAYRHTYSSCCCRGWYYGATQYNCRFAGFKNCITTLLYGFDRYINVRSVYISFRIDFSDTFEWIMEHFPILPDAPNFINSPFTNYLIWNASTIISLLGDTAIEITATFILSFIIGKIFSYKIA